VFGCSKRADNVVVPPVEVTDANCMQYLNRLSAEQQQACRQIWADGSKWEGPGWKVPTCKPGMPIC
jgi:hypothetical protein